MATITTKRLAKLRQGLALKDPVVTWVRPDVDAAMQSIIDLLQKTSTRTAVNSAIETAAPSVFNAAQKQYIFAIAVSELFEQEK